VSDDHFLPEIVDPETGEPTAPGELGELVLTTLTKEALPVLRYRTGDVTRFVDGPCPCGRTFRRIARFTGRVDDMLIIRGVNVFPSEIEAELLAEPAVAGHYAIVVDRRPTLPELEVLVEAARSLTDESRRELAARLAASLLQRLRVRARVLVVEPAAIPRPEGKARRVFERTDAHDPFPGLLPSSGDSVAQA
jgi:phenylacetate-CoA ligase